MIRNEGEQEMKRLSTALAAAGLLALAACGSTATNNAVVNDSGNGTDDTYNVAPDDLTANDLTGNETGNATDANGAADANASGNAQ
jgi:hypothetical protein